MVRRCVPVCDVRVALYYLPLSFVVDEFGEGFVGVGEQLGKMGDGFDDGIVCDLIPRCLRLCFKK